MRKILIIGVGSSVIAERLVQMHKHSPRVCVVAAPSFSVRRQFVHDMAQAVMLFRRFSDTDAGLLAQKPSRLEDIAKKLNAQIAAAQTATAKTSADIQLYLQKPEMPKTWHNKHFYRLNSKPIVTMRHMRARSRL